MVCGWPADRVYSKCRDFHFPGIENEQNPGVVEAEHDHTFPGITEAPPFHVPTALWKCLRNDVFLCQILFHLLTIHRVFFPLANWVTTS